MRIIDLADINGKYSDKSDFLAEDDRFEDKILRIKREIERTRREKPIVLVSGPSGSGKTTTAHALEKMLDADGMETHTVSLDNYFKTVTEEERATVDYESPSRVDGELLTEHIRKMVSGETVEIPVFDFVNTRRGDATVTLKRKKDELVIFEGIHSLNPSVISVPDEVTTKIYVSVDTGVNFGDGFFKPEYIRLLRRIARDKLHRGRDAAATISFYDSVKAGEDKYVAPYKFRSDYDVDSFIAYELGVYASALSDELNRLRCRDNGTNALLADLNCFLSKVERADAEFIGKNSLIREFV